MVFLLSNWLTCSVAIFAGLTGVTLSVKMKFFEGQSRWLKKDRI